MLVGGADTKLDLVKDQLHAHVCMESHAHKYVEKIRVCEVGTEQ